MIAWLRCEAGYEAEPLVAALAAGGIEATDAGGIQDWTTALYRDPEAIGIHVVGSLGYAAFAAGALRRADVVAPVIYLADYPVGGRGVAEVLAAGADDVQRRDIDARELAARVAALSRRATGGDDANNFGGFTHDPRRDTILFNDYDLGLTKMEHLMLAALIKARGSICSRGHLKAAIYGHEDVHKNPKILDVLLVRIRAKIRTIDPDAAPIRTVWGEGWRIEGVAP